MSVCATSRFDLKNVQETRHSFVTTIGYLHQNLVLLRAHCCCELRAAGRVYLGHTAAASCERQAGFTSLRKRHVPMYLTLYSLLPFCRPSRRRKIYFIHVKPLRHETDIALNSATRYPRSCSDATKAPLLIALCLLGQILVGISFVN